MGTKRATDELRNLAADQLEQQAIPGTETPAKRRSPRTLLDQAVYGDLVIAYNSDLLNEDLPTTVKAIEQVREHGTAEEIVERWRDLGIIGPKEKPQVWECRPGGYYRLRKSGR